MSSTASLPAGIVRLIRPKARDIGAFEVRRALPSAGQRSVGPFVFLDQMRPAELAAGQGMDVRPHPHIGLATLTWLFDGEIMHRDSLGSVQPIRPGEVNWMTAGAGIVHSERSPADRSGTRRIFGLQVWLALPQDQADRAPAFEHLPAAAIPRAEVDGVRVQLIAGRAFGLASPLQAFGGAVYAQASLTGGAAITLPDCAPERALFAVDPGLRLDGHPLEAGTMAVIAPAATPMLQVGQAARAVLIGGDPLDGERFLWWNFVSHSRARIAQARRDWREGRFAKVPGDDEFIPLPEGSFDDD